MSRSQKKHISAFTGCRYIRNITLDKVRTFRSGAKLDCCFPDGKLAQWTIILGENGTGKTTLLQYIAGMTPIQDTHTVQLKNHPNGAFLFKPLLTSPDYISWHYGNLSNPKKSPKKLSARIELSQPSETLIDAKEEPTLRIKEGQTISKGEFWFTVKFGDRDKDFGVEITSTQREEHTFPHEFNLIGYGASRHVAGPGSPYLTSEDFKRNNQSQINSLFNDDIPLISPEQWLLGLDHLSKGETPQHIRFKKTLERAIECLCTVLPDVSAITIESQEFPSPGMAILFETHYGPVPFAGLSLGSRAMAAWIIDFVRRMHLRYPNLDEPQEGPAVVLIDEFDLHMHVNWQMNMIEYLTEAFPNTQFIISAHSPLIVQAADGKANIVVLKREECADGKCQVNIENEPIHVKGWRLDQIVTSDLYGLPTTRSKTYVELLKKRIALLSKASLTRAEAEELEALEDRLDREAPADDYGVITPKSSKKAKRRAIKAKC